MEIKTRSGICVTVDNSSPSKFLFFDRPVRTIELTKDESSQISALLTAQNVFNKKDILLKRQDINRVNADPKITKPKMTKNPSR